MLTIQYLEDSPALFTLDQKLVISKLRRAAECLPITHLLIGWNVPPGILEACRVEAEHLGMRLIRWQPLLTSDKEFLPERAWQTEGWMGNKLTGFHSMPEFTFACPNHPAMLEAVGNHIHHLIQQGLYQGFFLDRIRFPSPSTDPINELACFCEHCQRKAIAFGLDLDRVKTDLQSATRDQEKTLSLVNLLLGGKAKYEEKDQNSFVGQFLSFRKKCLLDFLIEVTRVLRKANLEIGLDCFSPGLTHMVGQDLRLMGKLGDWVKVMTYAHALGPAGLPFEIMCFYDYLAHSTNLAERQILDLMSQSIGLPLPHSKAALLRNGLSANALQQEVRRGIEACEVAMLVGMELVELEGVCMLKDKQIKADLASVKQAKADGLAISWDLLHIPLDRLALVRQDYFS